MTLIPPPNVLATWPRPNYTNPVTRGPSLIIVTIVFLTICTLFVLMRVYVRVFMKKSFGWDDTFIVVAYLFNVAVTASVLYGIENLGWDRHAWDIPVPTLIQSIQQVYINKLLYLFSSFFTIQSILFFCYRLAEGNVFKAYRWALHVAVVVNIACFVPFLVAQIVICRPIHAYWELFRAPGTKCLDDALLTFSGGIVKTLLDFGVTTLPIPLVLSLQLPRSKKFGVAILLGLGYVTTAAGGIRTYYIWKVFYDTYDLTWYQYIVWQAAAVESNLGIICASAPAVRPLFSRKSGSPLSSILQRCGLGTSPRASTNQRTLSNHSSRREDSHPPDWPLTPHSDAKSKVDHEE